jgi:broad-specificity NMP kinase
MPDLQRMGVDQNHVICTNMGYEHPRSHLALKKQHPKWNMIEKEYDHMRRLREKMHHHDLQYDELLKELSEYETGVERLHNQINSDLMKNVKILLDYCKSSMIERFLESGYAPDAQFIMTNIDLGTEFELLQAISQVVIKINELQYIAQY